MNSSPTYCAVALNNEGLDSLDAGCYDVAIERISKALGLIKGELTHAEDANGGCTCCNCMADDEDIKMCGCPQQQYEPSTPVLHFRDLKNGIEARSKECVSDRSSEHYVFDKPIAISLPRPPSSPSSPPPRQRHDDLVSLAFVLVFNLAMTYHLHALHEEATDSSKWHTQSKCMKNPSIRPCSKQWQW